jgi:hypothetical protein
MTLHENKEDFENLISLTADYLEIPEVFIEKDYWVTYILYNLANSDYKDEMVFKGGTSLSKAYKLIDRFSEDVDLVMMNIEGKTKNQKRNLLSKIPKAIALPPLEDLGKDHDDFRDSFGYKKRVYSYAKLKENAIEDYGHARPELILEVNFFFTPFPTHKMSINTYIYDYIIAKIPAEEHKSLIEDNGLATFDLNILCTSRTFFEKLLSLYRGCHKSIDILKGRIRHFYDIYILIHNDPKVKNIIGDKDQLLEGIINIIDDEKQHEMFCDVEEFLPLCESRFSKEVKNLKKELESSYNDFASMVYKKEDLPKFDDVFNTIEQLNDFIIKNEI